MKKIITTVFFVLAISIATLFYFSVNKIQPEISPPPPAPGQEVQIPETPKNEIQKPKIYYQVAQVVDGDTLDLIINKKIQRVRLVGINTPETVNPQKPVECFGREASTQAKKILIGKSVAFETDDTQSERDKYNRLLGYIYLSDGTLFNQYMISEGYGYEYTYNHNAYKFQKEFQAAEREARENQKGLWSPQTCNGEK